MPEKKYLVPVDFSKASVQALRYAAQMAIHETAASLLVFHVMTEPAGPVPFYLQKKLYRELEQAARKKLAVLLKRKPMAQVKSAMVIARATDTATAIARQVKKSRAAMIVMGSHGRTGIKRLMLGSVAEKTVSLVTCPVLIIKK